MSFAKVGGDKNTSKRGYDGIKRINTKLNFETKSILPATVGIIVVLIILGFGGAIFIIFDWEATVYFTLQETMSVEFPKILIAYYTC